jgi:hypothetical protein
MIARVDKLEQAQCKEFGIEKPVFLALGGSSKKYKTAHLCVEIRASRS